MLVYQRVPLISFVWFRVDGDHSYPAPVDGLSGDLVVEILGICR